MSDPWDAEQPVDAARAARLVGARFPDLRGAPVVAVATGWDNSVLLAGDVLFRFPRREQAVALQQHELAVLAAVAPLLPLPVPVPTHVAEPVDDFPWPFWGGPRIPGDELAVRPGVAREAAAEALGEFLRTLHGLRVEAVLPTDPMGRGTPGLRRELTRQWLGRLSARGLWQASAELDALVDSPLRPPDGSEVLVHGDLHLRHLLVDGSGRATGVIDWGDTCWADPSVDLSLLYAAFDGPARALALAAYGPVSDEREVRARALAVGLCAALADWASSTGEASLLPEYLRGLERAVS